MRQSIHIMEVIDNFYARSLINLIGKDSFYDIYTVANAINIDCRFSDSVCVEDIANYYNTRVLQKRGEYADSLFKFIPIEILNKVRAVYFKDVDKWIRVRQNIHNAQRVCEKLSIEYTELLELIVFLRALSIFSNYSMMADTIIKPYLKSKPDDFINGVVDNIGAFIGMENKTTLSDIILASEVDPPANNLDRFTKFRVEALAKAENISINRAWFKAVNKYKVLRKRERAEFNPLWYAIYNKEREEEIKLIKRFMSDLAANKGIVWFKPIINKIKPVVRPEINLEYFTENTIESVKKYCSFINVEYTPAIELVVLTSILKEKSVPKLIETNWVRDVLNITDLDIKNAKEILYDDVMEAIRFRKPITSIQEFSILWRDILSNLYDKNLTKYAKAIVYRTHPKFRSPTYVRMYKHELSKEYGIFYGVLNKYIKP